MSDTPSNANEKQPIQTELELPKQELDEPFDSNSASGKLSTVELAAMEKDKDRKEKRYFSAFKLIIGFLIFLGIIYAVEVYTSYTLSKGLSGHTDGIIEIIKTLLFTLSGYLFARKEDND